MITPLTVYVTVSVPETVDVNQNARRPLGLMQAMLLFLRRLVLAAGNTVPPGTYPGSAMSDALTGFTKPGSSSSCGMVVLEFFMKNYKGKKKFRVWKQSR